MVERGIERKREREEKGIVESRSERKRERGKRYS